MKTSAHEKGLFDLEAAIEEGIEHCIGINSLFQANDYQYEL